LPIRILSVDTFVYTRHYIHGILHKHVLSNIGYITDHLMLDAKNVTFPVVHLSMSPYSMLDM